MRVQPTLVTWGLAAAALTAGAAVVALMLVPGLLYDWEGGDGSNDGSSNGSSNGSSSSSEPLVPNPGAAPDDHVMVTNGERHTVPLEKIVSGGPPPDGIPSIDNPRFVSAAAAAEDVLRSDMVIGLEIGGDARAYPLDILVWHEIVNDVVGGVPVAVTYCPLCYTSQVFERTVLGDAVEFGTSGKLYNSNLVMYDRLTGTYWSQALGTAIMGDLAGHRLETVPFDVTTWGGWLELHPDTLILDTDTGYVRAYGADPYDGYYDSPNLMFPVEHKNPAMHPKEIIFGLESDGARKAYRHADVMQMGIINDHVGDTPVLLLSVHGSVRAFERGGVAGAPGGGDGSDNQTAVLPLLFDAVPPGAAPEVAATDAESGSLWSHDGLALSGKYEGHQMHRLPLSPGFWFEWAAFYPDTEVYQP